MSKIKFIILTSLFSLFMPFVLTKCSDLRTTNNPEDSKCDSSQCHGSTLLGRITPDSGRHEAHLNRGYTCENCHKNYYSNERHKNGIYDKDTDTGIVFFNESNSGTAWNNSSGSCLNIQCHVTLVPSVKNVFRLVTVRSAPSASWYGSDTGCTLCHAPGTGIDPLATNGSGTAGKHIVHVGKGIDCQACHSNYKSSEPHMNGAYGTGEPGIIVYFNSLNPLAVWNAGNTTCSSMNCHGSADWYTAAEMTCQGMPCFRKYNRCSRSRDNKRVRPERKTYNACIG